MSKRVTMSVEHQPTEGSKTPTGGGEGFVVSGRFRKARVKPIIGYGAYRGAGVLRVSARGIEVQGRLVRPLVFRLTVGAVLFAVPLVLTAGRFALGFIPVYLALEYLWLERGDIFLPWSSVSRFASDRRRLLVSIQMDSAEKHRDTIVLRTEGMDVLLTALKRYAPGRGIGQTLSPQSNLPATTQPVIDVPLSMESSPRAERGGVSSAPAGPLRDTRAEAALNDRRAIRERGWALPTMIAGGALLSVVITVAVMQGRPPSASGSTAVPVAAQQDTQASPPLNVESQFPGSAQGQNFRFSAEPSSISSDCIVNSQDGVMVYLSQCASWRESSGGYSNIYFFHVTFTNITSSPAEFQLQDLAIVTSEDEQYRAVYLGASAQNQQAFLPESATVLPHTFISGWVTFDASVAFVPSRISYIDKDQVLSVRFPCRELFASDCFDGG